MTVIFRKGLKIYYVTQTPWDIKSFRVELSPKCHCCPERVCKLHVHGKYLS